MADEYIKRILAKAEFTGNFRDEYPTALIHALIDSVPSADVLPVRHGRWVEWWPGDCAQIMTGEEMLFMCTECTAKFSEMYRYCPNCGALMETKR